MGTDDMAVHFVKCFNTHEGQVVLNHLKKIFKEEFDIPCGSDGMSAGMVMSYQRGSRKVIHTIDKLIEKGTKL